MMSEYLDDDLFRDDPAEAWRPSAPITPHYPPAAMAQTSWGMHVPRHLLKACEDAYRGAKDRIRVRLQLLDEEEKKESQTALEASIQLPMIESTPPAHSNDSRPVSDSISGISKPRRRLLGWEPPPEDHVQAYLASGGS